MFKRIQQSSNLKNNAQSLDSSAYINNIIQTNNRNKEQQF